MTCSMLQYVIVYIIKLIGDELPSFFSSLLAQGNNL